MSLSIWFWIIYVIGILLGGYEGYYSRPALPRNILLLILLFLLGLRVFGSPVQ